MKPKTYASPVAFKRALEDRLKGASASGVDFARRRQLLVFDRFLAGAALVVLAEGTPRVVGSPHGERVWARVERLLLSSPRSTPS